MSKKSARYIRYCYCIACKEEFVLVHEDKMICFYCKEEDSFVVLSEKEETEKELIQMMKKSISITRKMIHRNYLNGLFEKSEKEDLDELKSLKDDEDFFNKNPNPKKKDVYKIINKKNKSR